MEIEGGKYLPATPLFVRMDEYQRYRGEGLVRGGSSYNPVHAGIPDPEPNSIGSQVLLSCFEQANGAVHLFNSASAVLIRRVIPPFDILRIQVVN